MLKGKEWYCGCAGCDTSWPLAAVHTEVTEAKAQVDKQAILDATAELRKGLQMKYFVLTPTKNNAFGFASRAALRHYADCIHPTDPVLAKDLDRWVDNIELTLGRTT